ncbi:MAG: hypothetical protein JWO20_820 [Candidatus Angelobacter sp.]|jgi:outer membrane protein OmpA-like peptidoglycan-associated protein|nr:hypothetical protein [Candidatus Angelobacter sp.]
MSLRNFKYLAGFFLLLAVALMATAALAQEQQPSKVDIFAGYAWADTGSHGFDNLSNMPKGFTVASTYWFNRYGGLTIDSGTHFGTDTRLTTVQVGPSFRFPMEHVSPFGHVLVGLYALSPPNFDVNYNLGVTAGGGLDLGITPRVDFRLIQADLQYGRYSRPNFLNQKSEFAGARLATGLVFKFGTIGPPPTPPSAACSVNPTEVFEGEPVTATVTPANFNPKRTLTYAWSGTGVKVSSTNATANIDTKGLQPGSYAVKADVSDGKKGTAACTASFTVKQPRPPTISCSANPTTVQVNGTSQITCTGSSPDGRNLTYNYTASAGNISGTGNTATLNTTGAQPGTINVQGTATDDRNLSASATTSVTVEAPPPPPPPPATPEASKLNEIAFKKNSPRVDNAAKAILDEVALRLQRDADAKAVLVGQADPKETGAKKLAAQRAVNAKAYLVAEKGIDASRIEARTGSGQAMNTEIWLVPAGATFNGQGTEVVSEKVKPTATKHAAPAAKKKAAKKQ